VREEVVRVTPKERREPALQLLTAAAEAFSESRFRSALTKLTEAKDLSPRVATIRELLGLSAYRLEQWRTALQELRTFRRLTGETVHMPVEMDSLRALGRPDDVAKAWELYRELGGSRETDDEARVVYASFLLDQGKPRQAWDVIRPGRLVAEPRDSEVRRWYVAARVAAALGDMVAARQLLTAVQRVDPAFPGLDELEAQIS
jgi:predicted Zn-dependent protease